MSHNLSQDTGAPEGLTSFRDLDPLQGSNMAQVANSLVNFDGLKSRTVFCVWSGDNPMSTQRIQALWSIYNNVGCPVALITPRTLSDWTLPSAPIHPAYAFLSETHKADYLRCYLMHHYGGGYTDIKHSSASWHPFFETLQRSEALALGYTEIPEGMPHLEGELGQQIQRNYFKVIGLCAFIFRRKTAITTAWYQQLIELLDRRLDQLCTWPAQHPQDQFGVQLPSGQFSSYPFRWAELLGEIFHPLIYEHRNRLLHAPIAPVFYGYR